MVRHPAAPPPGDDPEAAYHDLARRFARLNLARLAAMAGAEGDEGRGEFERALYRVLSDFHLHLREEGRPTRRQTRSELEAIEARAVGLLGALSGLHYETWIEMQDAYEQRAPDDFDELRWAAEGLGFADVEWDTLTATLERLAEVAAETRRALPRRRQGRKADAGFREFVAGLARLYEAHSGEAAGAKLAYDRESGEASSPFLSFVDAVLVGFAPEARRSSSALAEVIRRTVGRRARANGKKG